MWYNNKRRKGQNDEKNDETDEKSKRCKALDIRLMDMEA